MYAPVAMPQKTLACLLFVLGTPINGAADLRQILLQWSEAFRTTSPETLLVYASTGSVNPSSGTPDTRIRARRILRRTPTPRCSTLIAAVVHG